MTMHLSVLITSLATPFDESLREFVRLGFTHVDLIGKADRPEAERQALADSGLIVDCVALGRDLPAGSALDAPDAAERRRAVECVQQQIADAAQLGARVAYVVPGKSPASLPAFADSCGVLASFARSRMMRLCVEHFPGSTLPTALGTLDWLQALDDVHLLLDLGHCLISKEDPVQVVERAGAQLGYVQVDDNDGVNDMHWPLVSGALTEPSLRSFLQCLRTTGYRNGMALELNGTLPNAVENLRRSREVVERILGAPR